MFPIYGAVQSYAWGKFGEESLVAQLKRAGCEDFEVNPKTSYAELWMGTHHSGPAIIKCPALEIYDGKTLESWLQDHKDAMGQKSTSTQLPFLLKVLSVNKALSIQAHPNKKHAEELHERLPNIYKDPNHKPEMAIALTEFQALCGFRPLTELQELFKDIPELIKIVGEENSNSFLNPDSNKSKILQQCFKDLMTCPAETFQPIIACLSERLKLKTNKSSHESLFLQISEEFPGDIGCLGLFFFNYLTLQPGQAIYLAANEPHAYLKGDCVECMACSDNVVRAGLTPKLKDVETLCSMLTYKMKSVDENIFKGIEESPNVTLYKPEVPDFALVHIKVSVPEETLNITERDTASIILVVKGEGKLICAGKSLSYPFGPGSIFFVSCGLKLEIKPLQKSNLSIFQAFSFM